MSIKIDDGTLVLPQSGSGINVSSTHNNVDPGTGPVLYAQAMVIGGVITGFSGGEANRVLIVQPTRNSPEEVAFDHQNIGSTAANRLIAANADIAITAFWGSCAMWLYDSVDQRWKEVG